MQFLIALLVACVPIMAAGSFLQKPQLNFVNLSPFRQLHRRDYSEFTCWLACSERATVMCHYFGFKDTGNAARPSSFSFDPQVSRDCQQKTTNSYASVYAGYDRGHMVANNHMDGSDVTSRESNHMTNIMPQTSIMNQQSFLAAEEIFECWRDIVNLRSAVGIIMGTNATNDHFVNSHGVRTPDWFWRFIQKETGEVIAWIFPNDNTARKDKLNSYLTSISEIELRSGMVFTDFTNEQKEVAQTVSWAIPDNCDKSRRR